MKELSNAGLMLMELIAESGEISGYEINRLVETRGCRSWADIGTTSIYEGLKRLKKRGLVNSRVDIRKKGKGPLPKKFKINKKGKRILNKEILNTLATAMVTKGRFVLGIAGLPFVDTGQAINALKEKKRSASKNYGNVKDKFKMDSGEKSGFHTKEVFRHASFFIECSIEFIESLIGRLKKEIKKEGRSFRHPVKKK